jgi:hypothetical protein
VVIHKGSEKWEISKEAKPVLSLVKILDVNIE